MDDRKLAGIAFSVILLAILALLSPIFYRHYTHPNANDGRLRGDQIATGRPSSGVGQETPNDAVADTEEQKSREEARRGLRELDELLKKMETERRKKHPPPRSVEDVFPDLPLRDSEPRYVAGIRPQGNTQDESFSMPRRPDGGQMDTSEPEASPRHTLTGHTGGIAAMVYSPTGRILVSGGYDRTMRIWDAEHGTLLQTITVLEDVEGYVTSVTISPDEAWVAAGSSNEEVKIWRVEDGSLVQTIRWRDQIEAPSRYVSFSPDGRYLAVSGGWGKEAVRIWNVAGGDLYRTLEWSEHAAHFMSFSPDGHSIAAAPLYHRIISIWDLATGQNVQTYGFRDLSDVFAYSWSGRKAATASREWGAGWKIRIWDLENDVVIQKFTAHKDTVKSMAFSPDGRILATTGSDRMVRIWDVESGRQIRTFHGRGDVIHVMAFSPCGRTIAFAAANGSIQIWDR